jgi:hypothetical protein
MGDGHLKVIAVNKISSITVDSENANFPIENVLDEHPKRQFKSDGDYQATITCVVAAGTSGIGIFGTNARGSNITITDPNSIDWFSESAWDDESEWAYSEPQAVIEIAQSGDSYALWGDFDYINSPMNVEIILTTTLGGTLEVGVLRIGEAVEFKNPKYGLQEGLVDYSIIAENSNGSTYYKQRDIVRTFSGQIFETRDDDFYNFMADIARDYGKTPKAWRMTDDDSMNWVVFARFQEMPTGSHDAPDYSNINFQLIEVL